MDPVLPDRRRVPAPAIEVRPSADLLPQAREAILALCDRAYGEDLRPMVAEFEDPVHVLASLDGVLVSHALWVTRRLAPGSAPPLRTAYVEAVATDPEHQRRGLGSAVMRALLAEVADFELAALCPSDRGLPFYRRLGWQEWTGPLLIRRGSSLIPTPDEMVMFHPLPRSPVLDPRQPLSAEWRPGELW
jgi:aminoglycoside 2'-N-acetyltransferase I